MNTNQFAANKIKELREKFKNTQASLASGIGTHTNTVSRWETCEYKIGIEELEKVAKFFGCPIRAIEIIIEANIRKESIKDNFLAMYYASRDSRAHLMSVSSTSPNLA